MIYVFLIIYIVLLALLIMTYYKKNLHKFNIIIKTLMSLSFVIIVVFGVHYYLPSCLNFVVIPFILCMIGDIILAYNSIKSSKNSFILGLIVFSFAHICFLTILICFSPLKLYNFVIPLVSFVFTFMIINMENMCIEDNMKKYILIYSIIIGFFLGKSMDICLMSNLFKNVIYPINPYLILIGSLLFYISDIILLFLYFYKKRHHVLGVFNYITYYIGMFLLAISTILVC